MRRFVVAALVVACAGLTGAARADDKAGPTGSWKWTVTRGDNKRDVTLKLKLEGDKLTGSMPGRGGQEVKIEDGTYKDGEVSFKIVREGQDGQKMTIKYTGKLEGDTIKGKTETERGGETQSRDWEAKRSKD